MRYLGLSILLMVVTFAQAEGYQPITSKRLTAKNQSIDCGRCESGHSFHDRKDMNVNYKHGRKDIRPINRKHKNDGQSYRHNDHRYYEQNKGWTIHYRSY